MLMIACCQMTIIEFSEWLQAELDHRGWNGNQLAVKAGLDRGIISRALNRERMPSPESLQSIAHALGYPAETVYRASGLLPKVTLDQEDRALLDYIVSQVPEEYREEFFESMHYELNRTLERRRKDAAAKPKKTPDSNI